MSLLSWFSGSSARANTAGEVASPDLSRAGVTRTWPEAAKPGSFALNKPPIEAEHSDEDRKIKRHARREQLYVVVRESMTHAGVLSGSYKFKVLSLDQRGDQFLVMMDVDQTFHNQSQKLADIEARMVQTAHARFKILVTAVYWRVVQTTMSAPPVQHRAQAAPLPLDESIHASPKPVSANQYDPIQEEEVAAFKQALAAASATPALAARTPGETRTGPRSYTLLTGFEDTEMQDSPALPTLSNTQYGDLR